MEPTRQAAKQLAQQGVIQITQKGQVGLLNTSHARMHATAASPLQLEQQAIYYAPAEAPSTHGTHRATTAGAASGSLVTFCSCLTLCRTCLQVVDPDNFKGPIRLRLANSAAGMPAQQGIAALLQPAAADAAAVEEPAFPGQGACA
jgi:hypothetical protein